MKDLNLYSIHGFVIAVEGSANKIFLREYGWAKIDSHSEDIKINLYVKPCKNIKDLPTKPAGSTKGMRIPFNENENILWYEEGVPLNVLLSYCEALIWWPDKTLLHAGAVVKDHRAFVFTGGGNVGKTSTVLNLLRKGYDYLSDDWLVIGDGVAYPMLKPIHVFDYNLKNKEIAKAVLGLKRFYYKPYFKFVEIAREYAPHRYLRFAFEVLKPVFHVELRKINPTVRVASPTCIKSIFYLERQKSKNIEIKRDITAEDLARRMAYVNLYEWNFFFKEYYKYAYLYGIRNRKIENKFQHDFSIMYRTFKKAELFRVIIPSKLDLTKVKVVSLFNLE